MLLSRISNMKIFRYVAGKLLENPLMAVPMQRVIDLAITHMGGLYIQKKLTE